MDLDKFFTYTLPSGCVLVAWYFLKQKFDETIDKVKKFSTELTEFKKEVDGRYLEVSTKLGGVMDFMLEKFSKWEDRIKDVMQDMMTIVKTRPESPERNLEISIVVNKMKTDFKKDIDEMRLRNQELISKFNGLAVSKEDAYRQEHVDLIRRQLLDIEHELNAANTEALYKIETSELKMKKTFQIMMHFNNEIKVLREQIERLGHGRIVLIEKGNKDSAG